jgi:sarcosine oxidase subunit beta
MSGYEVGIIGAGIHGAAAAFHLASRGVLTVVFDKGAPAGGPTGRSSAVCRSYYTNQFLAVTAHESIRMLTEFEKLTNGGESDFRRTGALFIHPPEDVPLVEETSDRLNDLGIRTELIYRNELMARYPRFSPDGVGIAALDFDAGYADPAGTTIGMLKRAVELGTATRLRTPILGIEEGADGTWLIVSAGGDRTACERVLIAAGPWTKPLAAGVGVDLPLTVERHVVGTFGWGAAEPMPLHADVAGGYYFRPEGDELFLVGSLHPAANADPERFAEAIADDEIGDLADRFVKRVPDLEVAEVRGGWASLYDVSPDWQPVIGEIAPGVFVDAGTSGHGFKLAPALGGHVADMILGRPCAELAQFHPRRFGARVSLAAGWGAARILG